MYHSHMMFYSLTFFGGYPFWGGLCFIAAGALSVSAVKQRNICLIRGSLAMNIVSCLFIFPGVILVLIDMSLNGSYNQDYGVLLAGKGILGMLAIFGVVEFIINCITAHLANQVVCANQPGPPARSRGAEPVTWSACAGARGPHPAIGGPGSLSFLPEGWLHTGLPAASVMTARPGLET
ncbi:membrane-spanning 4-domains subfamily A member 12-like [Talpa occidentalis]|uniref:membrane-spanning 4-domains subfamily A member 12-like n=1 Tax=Talpa occidentalis TaxID=50954 RepID=UPI00188F7AC7|nr:membrane-spanning 4-domains subfamily A member 12-like [Talpa occidentalis]